MKNSFESAFLNWARDECVVIVQCAWYLIPTVFKLWRVYRIDKPQDQHLFTLQPVRCVSTCGSVRLDVCASYWLFFFIPPHKKIIIIICENIHIGCHEYQLSWFVRRCCWLFFSFFFLFSSVHFTHFILHLKKTAVPPRIFVWNVNESTIDEQQQQNAQPQCITFWM